jgi:hypothetical protein
VAVLAEAADTFLAGIVKNRLIGRLTEMLRSQSDGDISPTSSALYIGWIKGSACTSRQFFLKIQGRMEDRRKKGRRKEKMECCTRKTLREITRIVLKPYKIRSREHTTI